MDTAIRGRLPVWAEKGGDGVGKEYLEAGLPAYLKSDIDALLQGEQENSTLLDCLWGEVYGSINSAFWEQEITKEQAEYLRDKYLGI